MNEKAISALLRAAKEVDVWAVMSEQDAVRYMEMAQEATRSGQESRARSKAYRDAIEFLRSQPPGEER